MEAMITAPSRHFVANHGLAFVGSFTTARRKARGQGIHAYRIDHQSGTWSLTDHIGDLINPSFLITDPARSVLYAAHGDSDYASAFSIDPQAGTLHLLGRATTGGRNGVHLALDPFGRFLIVANYASGSLSVLPIRTDGSLGSVTQVLDLPGLTGPHGTEQTGAHPHHVVFDPSGRFVLVPDKGLDRIFVLTFDSDLGRLSLAAAGHAIMRPGAGPRHIVFHPRLPIAFVVNELDSSVATCRWDGENGVLDPLQAIPSLPPDFFGASTAAAIVITPDGRHVFVSNRGQDGITHFEFDARQSPLKAIDWTPANSRDPRFMTLNPAGDRLLVANEQGDNVTAFRIAARRGGLIPDGIVLNSASPCAVAFL
jgi:6-phosphogluconolactonase